MPYRQGDPTVEVEAVIEMATAKAYLIKPTMGNKEEVWLPKSQTVEMGDANENGTRLFTVTKWWFDRAGLTED